MTDPLRLNPLNRNLINKSIHTSDGIHIGNIHEIDNDWVIVKRHIITNLCYHIPLQNIREWDGHAVWLIIDNNESKNYIFQTYSRKISATEPLTLDLEQDFLQQIIYQADRYGISINQYINQLIKRYLERDSYEPNAGLVLLSEPVVKELFNNLTAEQILSLAKSAGKNALKSTVVTFAIEKQKSDLNLFLSWLEDEMNIYFTEIRHNVSKDNGYIYYSSNNYSRPRHHTFILKHDAGPNYSVYYKTVLELLFNEMLQKHIDLKTIGNKITLELEESSEIE